MQTVISIDKIIVAVFGWRNQYNNVFNSCRPPTPTVNGAPIKDEFARAHSSYPLETAIERAMRLDIIDKWIPCLWVRMQGGVRTTFTGGRAISIWEAYKAKQFGAATHHENKRRDTTKTKKA